MNIKKCLLVFMAVWLGLSSAVWAGSRSAVINVSCTILPVMQISSARGAESNLKNSFSTVQTWEKRAGSLTKVLSVTAL